MVVLSRTMYQLFSVTQPDFMDCHVLWYVVIITQIIAIQSVTHVHIIKHNFFVL